VEVLTANNNTDLLIEQARQFLPNVVVIGNEEKYPHVKEALHDLPVKVYAGAKAIEQVVQMDTIDMVLTAMVGYSGLLPTIKAIEAGKNIALANKETLVVAGDIITRLATGRNRWISFRLIQNIRLFSSALGEYMNPLEKIILTCSGGPFRGKTREELAAHQPRRCPGSSQLGYGGQNHHRFGHTDE
jgi:1-deoxy-D-xylulose-5-phosphate reductoisomerase